MSSLKIILLFLVLSLVLCSRLLWFYSHKTGYNDNQKIILNIILLSDPKIINNYQQLNIQTEQGNNIKVIVARYPQYYYGDKLSLEGTVKYQEKTKSYSLVFPKITKNETPSSPIESFLKPIFEFRKSIIVFFEKSLPKRYSGLLMGIVFGIKTDMTKEFEEYLKNTGTMHVIAASGMNVTLVAGFLSSFFVLFFRRQIALAISILGIIFYTILAGFQASIIRAAIMGGLSFSSQIIGRQSLAIYSLLLSGFIMLFISPSILFDIGFQLSFLATAGLVLINPVILSLMPKKSLGITTDFVTTISAQLATLPIFLVNFGFFSLTSVLANALILWTIPPLMILGGIGGLIGVVFSSIGKLILYLALPLLFYFETVITLLGKAKLGISLTNLPLSISMGYLLLLSSILMIVKNKKDE